MEGESDLVRRAKAGDRQAYAALVARCQQAVWDLAWYMLQDREEAQDVAQEAFVRALCHLHRFRDGAPFRPWVLRIAANLARDRLRRRGRAPLPLEAACHQAVPGGSPEAAVVRQEQVAAVRAALARLPPEDRALVVLFHAHRMPQEELAGLFGLALTQVKNRLYRARIRLRELLAEVKGDGL